jgi:hypothetical protein
VAFLVEDASTRAACAEAWAAEAEGARAEAIQLRLQALEYGRSADPVLARESGRALRAAEEAERRARCLATMAREALAQAEQARGRACDLEEEQPKAATSWDPSRSPRPPLARRPALRSRERAAWLGKVGEERTRAAR